MGLTDIIGIIGQDAIEEIVNRFYNKIEDDPVLRPLYREDLTKPKLYLKLYLIQIFGGERGYAKERGRPRTISRHIPITIGQRERDRWMELMTQSIQESKISDHPKILQKIVRFFDMFSTKLINNKMFNIYNSTN